MEDKQLSRRKARKQRKSKGSVERKDTSPKSELSGHQTKHGKQDGSPAEAQANDSEHPVNKQGEEREAADEPDKPKDVPEGINSNVVLTPSSYIAQDHVSPSAILSPYPPPSKPRRSWKNVAALLALLTVLLACVAAAIWALVRWASQAQIELTVPSLGTVHGLSSRVEGNVVYAFLGVRFAEATSGSNRFKPPVPVENLAGTSDAGVQNPGCDEGTDKSEDCLHLNIWTPCTMARERDCQKAVVLFLFGIDFYEGNNNRYDGSYFAALGDVVLVVPNFRLGFLGLFSAGTPDAPGNLLLYDQTTALRWTIKHIEYFGGNKSNIVVMGSATGAWSVGAHLLSTDTYWKDTISRIILHSESPFRRYVQKVPPKLGSMVDCPEGPMEATAACLRNTDVGTILEALVRPDVTFGPTYSSKLLPKAPWGLAQTAIVKGKDAFLGAVSTESCALVTDAKRNSHAQGNASVVTSIDVATSVLRMYDIANTTSLFRLYNVDAHDMAEVYTLLDELFYVCPVRSFAQYLTSQGNRVHGFVFQHRPSFSTFYECPGAARFQELDFIFGYPIRNTSAVTAEETELSRKMIGIWSKFAKTGSLPPVEDDEWPVHTKERAPYVHLAPNSLKAVENIKRGRCYDASAVLSELYGWLKREG